MSIMQSIESLAELHSLNWLERTLPTLPAGTAGHLAMQAQIMELRRRLPVSLLTYHDRMLAKKRPSVVRTASDQCNSCHLRLPSGTAVELNKPNNFVLCPHCGVFVTQSPSPAQIASQKNTGTHPAGS